MATDTTIPMVVAANAGVTYQLRDRQPGRRLPNLGNTRSFQAVQGVSFVLHRGEVLGVIGRNGAGKSTLLSALSGAIQCTEGEILVSSQPKMLSVFSFMNARLTGRENIRLGLLGLGFHPRECDDLFPAVAEFTELGDFIDLPMTTYSAGMKARLRFAVATQQAPEILLLDEALAVGDQHFREKAYERIDEIRSQAGVVVLASHDMNEVRRTCSRVLWLRDGVPQMLDETEPVVRSYIVEYSA